MSEIKKAIQAASDEHYKKFGLTKGLVQQWEDGLRTEDKPGSYEWWYFDTHLTDGSIIVVTFYTKSLVAANGPITPYAQIEITAPDGKTTMEQVFADISDCHYDKEKCDVRIGKCTFRGDLHRYEIHFENENVVADIELDGTVPSFRGNCGVTLFGDNEEYEFAWLPAVPDGKVKADVVCHGVSKHYEGIGYHDHNWGNAPMLALMNHWYWGRALVGPYTVITAWIYAAKEYGYKEFQVFMLAKDGKIVADNDNNTLTFTASDRYMDDVTGKPVHNHLAYHYTANDGTEYIVTYQRQNDINRSRFVDELSEEAREAALAAGLCGAYLRFSGLASVEVRRDSVTIEKYEDPAVWELMYFGEAMDD